MSWNHYVWEALKNAIVHNEYMSPMKIILSLRTGGWHFKQTWTRVNTGVTTPIRTTLLVPCTLPICRTLFHTATTSMIGYWWTHSSLVSCITYLFIKKKQKNIKVKRSRIIFYIMERNNWPWNHKDCTAKISFNILLAWKHLISLKYTCILIELGFFCTCNVSYILYWFSCHAIKCSHQGKKQGIMMVQFS
jgi:hypothetical protein